MDAVIYDYSVGAEEARRMVYERQMDFSARTDTGDGSPTAGAVRSWIERMAGEIGRSVVSLTAKSSEQRPRHVVLIGNGAGVPGIAEALAKWSGLPVEIGDPWNGMRVSMVCSLSVREPEAVYAAATGLAMAGLTGEQSVNLLPRHAIEERRQRRKATAVLAGLGALAAVLLVSLLLGASGVHTRTSKLHDLKARTRLAQQKARRLTPELRAEAASVKRMVADIAREKPSCLEFLRLASANLPRSVWLSDLAFEGGKSVVLKGGALSNSAVADVVDSLASLELFDSLSLDYSSLSREGGSQNYEFQITCVLPASTLPSGRAEGKTSGRAASNERTGIIVQ
jgi:Tfp pilus assembly protein PilN